jgi:hypothetical protein
MFGLMDAYALRPFDVSDVGQSNHDAPWRRDLLETARDMSGVSMHVTPADDIELRWSIDRATTQGVAGSSPA